MAEFSAKEIKTMMKDAKGAMRDLASKISLEKMVKGVADVGKYGAGTYTVLKFFSTGVVGPTEDSLEALRPIAEARLADALPQLIISGLIFGGCVVLSHVINKALETSVEAYNALRDSYKELKSDLFDKQKEDDRDNYLNENGVKVDKQEGYDNFVTKHYNENLKTEDEIKSNAEIKTGTYEEVLAHYAKSKHIDENEEAGKEVVEAYKSGVEAPFSDGTVEDPNLFVKMLDDKTQGDEDDN